MKNSNILITGGAGFIGSHLAHSLKSYFKKIFIIDNLKTGDLRNLDSSFEFIESDCAFCDYEKYLKNVDNFDAILHFAGQSSAEISFKDPIYDFNSNLQSTIKLLNFAKDKNVNSFVFASSVTVYKSGQEMPLSENSIVDNDNSFYAISKLASEKYIKLFSSNKLHTTSLRLFNIYGSAQNLGNPNQGMLSIYLEQALNSNQILVKGSLDRTRDFVHVFDVVDIVKKVLRRNHENSKSINVCTSKPTKVKTLIDLICKNLNKDISIINAGSTKGDTFEHWGSNSLCEELLEKKSWISLKEGLIDTIKAFKNDKWFDDRIS